MCTRGFLLIEALLAILLLSLVLVASLGGIAQALRLASRGEETTKGVLEFERLLFELETGQRLDLVYYGGKEKRGESSLEIQSEAADSQGSLPSFHYLKAKLLSEEGKELLFAEAFLPESFEL